MAFTRNKTDAAAVGLPQASGLGMTAVDPLFPHPPEVTVLVGGMRAGLDIEVGQHA